MVSLLLEFRHYLDFLKNLDLPTNLIDIIEAKQHKSDDMLGWQGLASCTCLNEINEIYDIDIRYAWSDIIFKQNLIDYGWNESILLEKKDREMPYKHKIIIYLCDICIASPDTKKLEKLEEHFSISCYWQSIWHLYLYLPIEHPFEHQLSKDERKNSQELFLSQNAPFLVNKENGHTKTVLMLPDNPERKGEGGLRTHGVYKQSNVQEPLISIITVVFNGEKYIEQTIQSVINQSYKNIEYIIIDGSSTDKTLDIIKRYEFYIDYWVSEPDLNIYDAMNKGLMCALGEFVNFMNVGDLFFNHKIIEILNFRQQQYSICGINIFFSNLISGIIYVNMQNRSIPHQSLFLQRNIFEKYIFNSSFQYSADAELWMRFNDKKNVIKAIDQVVSISRFGGISTSGKYLIPRMMEHLRFDSNKIKILVRFIPKIILSFFLNDIIQEIIYFRLKRKIN